MGRCRISLDGVSVSMGGKAGVCLLHLAGSTQCAGAGRSCRADEVTVTAAGGTSTSLHCHREHIRPGIFPMAGQPGGRDASRLQLRGKARYVSRAPTTVAAKPGEVHCPVGNGIRSYGPGSAARSRGAQRQLPDGIVARRDHQQHAGRCLRRGARARLGRLVPDRYPSAGHPRRWRLAHSGEHRQRRRPPGLSFR